MRRLLAACAVIVALAFMASSAKAQNKFDYCLLCHGANANGNAGIRAPKLSGMEPWYLARQLENFAAGKSEEHTSELQSLRHLVCRLLLEKKKNTRCRLRSGRKRCNMRGRVRLSS